MNYPIPEEYNHIKEDDIALLNKLITKYGESDIIQIVKLIRDKFVYENVERFKLFDGFYINFKEDRLYNTTTGNFSIDVSKELPSYVGRYTMNKFLHSVNAYEIFRAEYKRLNPDK